MNTTRQIAIAAIVTVFVTLIQLPAPGQVSNPVAAATSAFYTGVLVFGGVWLFLLFLEGRRGTPEPE